jgi:hypothetical protein
VRVAKKLEDTGAGLIEFGKKDDQIQSIVLDYNEMISEVDTLRYSEAVVFENFLKD